PYDGHQDPGRKVEVDVPEYRLVPISDGQVANLDRQWSAHSPSPSSAPTIVPTLCRTTPSYVSAPEPGPPSASEYRLPPSRTSTPRARPAASTASMLRADTDVSMKSAGIRRSATNRARSCTSAVPASATVEIPCSPRTSKPYARPK